jgi:hypothetical protein
MKGILFALCLVSITFANAQNWNSMTPCPNKLDHTAGFCIGDYFYIGTGYNGSYGMTRCNIFRRYDIIQDSWTNIPSLPDSVRTNAISFVINGKAYVGQGYAYANCLSDLYEYDPGSNNWTQKASCPFVFCSYGASAAFALNGKGYVMGAAWNNYTTTNVYQYDPVSDTWTQKNDFPGTGRDLAFAAAVNGKGYFGMGRVWNPGATPLSDIWEYNDQTDTWTWVTSHPDGGNFWTNAMEHDNSLIVFGGGFPLTSSVKKFDPVANQWSSYPNTPYSRHASIGFSHHCFIYLAGGYGPGNLAVLDDITRLKVDSTCVQTSIATEKPEPEVEIYPNPIDDIVHLFLKNDQSSCTAVIANCLGEVILEKKLYKGKNDFNSQYLPKGIYFCTIKNGDKTVLCKKLVRH